MKKQFIIKKGVKIPNKLCEELYKFIEKYVAQDPTGYIDDLIKAIEDEQNQLRALSNYRRCDKAYVSTWKTGEKDHKNLAIYRSYNTYCSSQGCFINVYSRDINKYIDEIANGA